MKDKGYQVQWRHPQDPQWHTYKDKTTNESLAFTLEEAQKFINQEIEDESMPYEHRVVEGKNSAPVEDKPSYAKCVECSFSAPDFEAYKTHRRQTGHHLEKVSPAL